MGNVPAPFALGPFPPSFRFPRRSYGVSRSVTGGTASVVCHLSVPGRVNAQRSDAGWVPAEINCTAG